MLMRFIAGPPLVPLQHPRSRESIGRRCRQYFDMVNTLV
jgi:hypothetical protein